MFLNKISPFIKLLCLVAVIIQTFVSIRHIFFTGNTRKFSVKKSLNEIPFPVILNVMIYPGLKQKKLHEFGFNATYLFFLGKSFKRQSLGWHLFGSSARGWSYRRGRNCNKQVWCTSSVSGTGFLEQDMGNSKFSCLFRICCSGNSLHGTVSLLVPVPSTLFPEQAIGNRLDSSCSQNRSYGTTVTAYIYQHA